MLSLVANPGTPEEQGFALPQGRVTIGRTQDNHVYCLHKSLSRTHAQVDLEGSSLKITDLQSKNGVFFNGRRVRQCEVREGDTFRCGDIEFLVEGTTTRIPPRTGQGSERQSPRRASPPVVERTLPSKLIASDLHQTKRAQLAPAPAAPDSDPRHKEKLGILVRASELLVSSLAIDPLLEETLLLLVDVLEIDRIALLVVDPVTRDLSPRVLKSFGGKTERPYSQRVVEHVASHGLATTFADVSSDHSIPGRREDDAHVRAAMCVPVQLASELFGVLYVDSVSRTDLFGADDLTLLSAVANLTAAAIEREITRETPIAT